MRELTNQIARTIIDITMISLVTEIKLAVQARGCWIVSLWISNDLTLYPTTTVNREIFVV